MKQQKRKPNYLYWRKSRIRRQLKDLNENLPSHYSFIFIRTHKKVFKLIFVDELSLDEALKWARETMPHHLKDRSDFGFYLRSWRKAQGLRLVDLQELTGISFQNLSLIENARRSIGKRTRDRIEEALRLHSAQSIIQKHKSKPSFSKLEGPFEPKKF